MPGIAGLISREAPAACRRRLAAMIASLRHEPHYASVACEAPEIGVYAASVAHSGSYASRESGNDHTGGMGLVFAGECFQDADDDIPAPAAAERNRTASAGSLLRLYDRLGENWVRALNGLFSGLLVDRRRRRAVLFVDRYGVERLYVHESEDATYFASEAKAPLCVVPALRSFDEEAVAQFLSVGCPLGTRTLFRGMRTLEGGSIWSFEGGVCRKSRYFTPSEWESQPALEAEDFQSQFQQSFRTALSRYVRGESRIGISLTGGLDSRMIMAALPALATSPLTYTFGALQGRTRDVRVAEHVASACGLEHRTLRIGPDFLSGFADYADRTVYITDGCAGVTGAHEIYLNEQARELASVRLTGNFGSEVLRSASTFKPIGLAPELVARDLRPRIAAVAGDTAGVRQSPVTFAAFAEVPSKLYGIMAAAKSQVTFRTPYLDNDLVALTYRAPASVRRSSASALRLVADARPALAGIPTDRSVLASGSGAAYLMRRLFAEFTFRLDYAYLEAIPPALMPFDAVIGALHKVRLLGQHKFLPYRLWFRRELAEYITAVLSDASTSRLAYWNGAFLRTIAPDHVAGRRNFSREIDAVVTLAAVDRLLLRARTTPPRVSESLEELSAPSAGG